MRVLFYLVTLGLSITQCKESYSSPQNYLSWLNQKGSSLWSMTQGNAFAYSLKFKPAAEMAINEVGLNTSFEAFDSTLNEYEGMEYYLLKIESNSGDQDVIKTGIREESEYYNRLNYLSYEMQYDVALLTGLDTIPCVMHHFERSYGAAPDLKILLGFPQQDSDYKQERQVLFFSRIEPVAQWIKFDIPVDQIRKIPVLKF